MSELLAEAPRTTAPADAAAERMQQWLQVHADTLAVIARRLHRFETAVAIAPAHQLQSRAYREAVQRDMVSLSALRHAVSHGEQRYVAPSDDQIVAAREFASHHLIKLVAADASVLRSVAAQVVKTVETRIVR